MKISEKIINIRNDNNLTQEELAEILGVSRQTVSNWENNKCYPDIATLILISEKFNVSFDNMIKEDREMVKDLDKKINFNKYKIIFIISLILIIIFLPLCFIGYKYHLLDYYDYEYNDSTLKEIAENITILQPERKMELANTKYYDMNIYIPEKLNKDDIFEFNYVLGEEDGVSLYKYDSPFYELEFNKEFFKGVDYQYIFEKNKIYNIVDLIRYFEHSYDDKRNILWSGETLKLNFLAKQFMIREVNWGVKDYKIYYWFNFNNGYLIESEKHYSINIYDGNNTYYIGLNKNVIDFEETLKIISSIYFG